jgi:tRNA C32,U32 (ribose-2'-O)-methylase TrmJ
MVNDDKENKNEEERMKEEEMEELFRLFRKIVNEMFVAYDYRKNYETSFRKLQTERALAEKEIDLFSEVGFEWDNEWQEGMR